MEEIKNCPICGSEKSHTSITCEDFTVSHEKYEIRECDNCTFKFTSPRPNTNDLGKYYKSEEYVSHTDTKKGLVNSVYHLVRNFTLLKKLRLVLRYAKPGNILDYGCGTGAFLEICKKSKWNVFGIEPDFDARAIAQNRLGKDLVDGPESFSILYENEKMDVITLWHVLEHIPDLNGFFNFIDLKLSDKGTLIVAVPNCNSFDAKHFKSYWAAYDVPRHLWHFTPNTITDLFRKKGFKKVNTLPMVFDSFYVSMLSNKYKTGSSRLFSSFYTGLLSNFKANKDQESFSSQIYIFKRG